MPVRLLSSPDSFGGGGGTVASRPTRIEYIRESKKSKSTDHADAADSFRILTWPPPTPPPEGDMQRQLVSRLLLLLSSSSAGTDMRSTAAARDCFAAFGGAEGRLSSSFHFWED